MIFLSPPPVFFPSFPTLVYQNTPEHARSDQVYKHDKPRLSYVSRSDRCCVLRVVGTAERLCEHAGAPPESSKRCRACPVSVCVCV